MAEMKKVAEEKALEKAKAKETRREQREARRRTRQSDATAKLKEQIVASVLAELDKAKKAEEE